MHQQSRHRRIAVREHANLQKIHCPRNGQGIRYFSLPTHALHAGSASGKGLESDLIDYCLQRLSKYKCPRSVDFVDELPRLPSGKLLKRELKARYPWGAGG